MYYLIYSLASLPCYTKNKFIKIFFFFPPCFLCFFIFLLFEGRIRRHIACEIYKTIAYTHSFAYILSHLNELLVNWNKIFKGAYYINSFCFCNMTQSAYKCREVYTLCIPHQCRRYCTFNFIFTIDCLSSIHSRRARERFLCGWKRSKKGGKWETKIE